MSMDQVLQQMTELTAAVKSGTKQNLDWETVQKQFGAQLDAYVAAQVKAAMDAKPNFRQGGAPIGIDGQLQKNRYRRHIKGLRRMAGTWMAGRRCARSTC